VKMHTTAAVSRGPVNLLAGALVVVCLGLTGYTPVRGDEQIKLLNPSFEEGQQAWSTDSFKRFEGLIETERQDAHEGNVSLKLTSRTGSESPWVFQEVAQATPGATYRATVWVKGDGKTVPSLIALRLSSIGETGEVLSARATRVHPPLNRQWMQIQVESPAHEKAHHIRCTLQLSGNGTIWLDDVTLSMVQPPSPITLTPPRQVITPGKNQTAHVSIHLREPRQAEDSPPFGFTITRAPSGAPYKPQVEVRRTDAGTFTAAMHLPSVSVGAYEVRCSLPGIDGQGLSRLFVPLASRRPKGLSDTGAFLVDGSPFFPIGLCHVGPGDYALAAKQGFNCVQGSAAADPDILGRSLDAARDARLLVDVPLYADGRVAANLPLSIQKLKRRRNHRALVSWKIVDQPDFRTEVADEVPEVYRALRAQDNTHALALSLADSGQCKFWAHFCDSVQVSAYALPAARLELIAETVSRAREHLEPWQNLTVLLQAGWTKTPMNQPTFAQARAMLYLALISGAKGIFWYAYRDPGWDLAQTPLWGRLREINEETAALAPALLLGTQPPTVKVTADNPGLHWTAREHADKIHVLLANPSRAALKVTIDSGFPVVDAPCLHGRPAAIEQERAVITLQPMGADTVILKRPKTK